MARMKNFLIGFIGQGYVGKNYADDFERHGFSVVRYALEPPFISNKAKIKKCDIVFVAVPTPTVPVRNSESEGGQSSVVFDDTVVCSVMKLVGTGKIAVIKSTILPETTEKVQEENPGIIVLCSPEFLSEATAKEDATHPFSNIIGMPVDDAPHRVAADRVLALLPKAPYSLICTSREAEIIKYAHNFSAYTQIIAFNIMYDVARQMGCEWKHIEEAIKADPLVCNRYANPIHKKGRGAGGHCFIKDIAALRTLYEKFLSDDARGIDFLHALEKKNKALLLRSGKDIEILEEVYGKE